MAVCWNEPYARFDAHVVHLPVCLRVISNVLSALQGGEAVALQRLQYYLWDSDLISNYFNIRNGMLGGNYSTKLSAWLAHGCISPRTVYHEVRRYEAERKENKSTYWVIFELIWRDYYRFFALKHGNAMFFEKGTVGKELKWNSDMEVRRASVHHMSYGARVDPEPDKWCHHLAPERACRALHASALRQTMAGDSQCLLACSCFDVLYVQWLIRCTPCSCWTSGRRVRLACPW